MRLLPLPLSATVPVLGQETWGLGESPKQRLAQSATPKEPQEIDALKFGIDLGMTLIDRPDPIASMEHLVDLHRLILSTTDAQPEGRIEAHLNLAEVAEWAERLQEVQLRCFLLYLS